MLLLICVVSASYLSGQTSFQLNSSCGTRPLVR